MEQCIALVDCNNFFVSCERVFRPDLDGRPMVVLSSNDGCVISRSDEAKRLGIQNELPVKKKAKARRIEERTVLIFKDGDHVAIRKRPDKGLLAGMYEFPNLDGKLTMDEVTAYSKSIGLAPIRVKKLRNAKHIFSHIEWHMTAYEVIVDELEKNCKEEMIFAHPEEIQKEYSMPSAFSAWKVK